MAERIPVLIVAGFLGSGKTTLLNHLLRREPGAMFVADAELAGGAQPLGLARVTDDE
nr:GTP-binding protein [Nocardia harenae]